MTWVAIFLTVLIIPFRAAAHHGQWVVAALAYIAWGAKAFEYATLFRWVKDLDGKIIIDDGC